MKDPVIAFWVKTVSAETTQRTYAWRLKNFLSRIKKTPEEFLHYVDPDESHLSRVKSQRRAAIEIETVLTELSKESQSVAGITKKAIKSFTTAYKVVDFPLTLKLKSKRVRIKRRFTWQDALKIIEKTPDPYRGVLKFMLYGALDETPFTKINRDDKEVSDLNGGSVIRNIQEQMKNEKSYILLNMPPRKNALDTYLILVPKIYVPNLPAYTIRARGRGGTLIDGRDLQAVWRRAAERARIYWPGLGPHHCRSAFRSECQALGIDAVGEEMMGHTADGLGYAREGLSEEFLLNGPQKTVNGKEQNGLLVLWSSGPVIDRNTMFGELERMNERLAILYHLIGKQSQLSGEMIVQAWHNETDPERKRTLEQKWKEFENVIFELSETEIPNGANESYKRKYGRSFVARVSDRKLHSPV